MLKLTWFFTVMPIHLSGDYSLETMTTHIDPQGKLVVLPQSNFATWIHSGLSTNNSFAKNRELLRQALDRDGNTNSLLANKATCKRNFIQFPPVATRPRSEIKNCNYCFFDETAR